MIDTYWGHQIISRAAYDDFLRDCDIENDDFVNGDDQLNTAEERALEETRKLGGCNNALDTLLTEAGSLNPYGTCIFASNVGIL